MSKMRNITLSASEELISKARERARSQRVSLNSLFQSWLGRYVGGGGADFDALMGQLEHIQSNRTFSREELNER